MSPASNELPGFFICHTIYIFAEKDKATMSKYLSILFLCCLPTWLWAGENYRFRVYLKDKGDDGFRVEEPEAYLSRQAIERRAKNDIAVTDADFPISRSYIAMLSETGATPVVQSKWFATVVVESPDSTVAEQLQQLAIVDSVKWIWKGNLRVPAEEKREDRFVSEDEPLHNEYGYSYKQIKMLNGTKLHEAGFRGEGMRVAVIDAGFMNADRVSAFDSLRLLGTHNVVFPGKSVFVGDDHGTKVLSCLAADIPGVMVGTAPKASYLLLKSEDSDSEYPVEEDYWTAAVEYADSAGAGFYWTISYAFGILQTLLLNKVYSPAKLRAQAEAEYNERMKNAAKEEKRKRQTEDLNAVSEYEGEKLTQKEINRRKLAAARKADAEKYGEEYHEDNDDDT